MLILNLIFIMFLCSWHEIYLITATKIHSVFTQAVKRVKMGFLIPFVCVTIGIVTTSLVKGW